jgi:SAM-dependent methyltransferase
MSTGDMEKSFTTSLAALEPAAWQYDLVSPPKPKPSSLEIQRLHADFYGAIAQGFDEFNAKSTRGLYFDTVNIEVARHLSARKSVASLLSIAAGTGRREESIRRLSNLDFQVTCVDTSKEMCTFAAKRGFEVICAGLPELSLRPDSFDACIFLNGFEVLSSHGDRLRYLQKIYGSLKKGGLFFVDVMDIDDKNDSWASLVKKQFESEDLQNYGYDLGDCFCRRTDQESIVFAHYSSQNEMEKLFAASQFEVKETGYFSEETGARCAAHEGNMFFVAEKV